MNIPWKRLWLLPAAVAVAYWCVLPFSGADDFSSNGLIVLELLIATFTFVVIVSPVLAPGAVAHLWLTHALEDRGVRLVTRAVIAVLASPLIAAWIFLLPDVRDDRGVWVLYGTTVTLFACSSLWYGSHDRRR